MVDTTTDITPEAAAVPASISSLAVSRAAVARRRRASLLPYLLILPTAVFIATFTLYPALRAGYASLFRQNQAVRIPRFIGLGNYSFLLTDDTFWQVIKNTLVFVIVTTPIAIALALLLALLLNQKLRALGAYRLAIFHPTVLPMVSAATIYLFVFAPGYGLMNEMLRLIGIQGPNWLGSDRFALPALMLMTIWKEAGYFMIFYLAGLQNLSTEYMEAAQIDGANTWQTIRHITLPLLTGTTLFVTTIAAVNSFQTVDQIYILTQGGPNNATNMLLFHLYETQFRFLNTGVAYALSVILLLVLLVFTLVNFRLQERSAAYE